MKRIVSAQIDAELVRPQPKVILLIGQRRVGKTFELRRLMQSYPNSSFVDFEDFAQRQLWAPSLATLERLLGPRDTERLLLLDEVQLVKEIGSILKLIHDHFPRTRIVASGSAAFLLLKNVGDSLAGRSITLNVHPLLPREMADDADNTRYVLGDYDRLANKPFVDANLEHWLVYGSLPEIWAESDAARKETLLRNYVNSLMLKDIFELEGIRLPDAMQKLVRLLALQVGNEVNPNELATQLNMSRPSVLDYIGILEKFRLVRILTGFSGNLRNEVTRSFKVYFNDLGVRNALMGNFVPTSGRTDAGAMFENFVVNLLAFGSDAFQQPYQFHFWRTASQNEVDLVMVNQRTAKLVPVEIKLTQEAQVSRKFMAAYGDQIEASFGVNRGNVWRFG